MGKKKSDEALVASSEIGWKWAHTHQKLRGKPVPEPRIKPVTSKRESDLLNTLRLMRN